MNLTLQRCDHNFQIQDSPVPRPLFRLRNLGPPVTLSQIWCSDSVAEACATPWTAARQAPLSMRPPRQEYWSGLPFPPPGNLPDPGIKPVSSASPALAGQFFTTKPPGRWSLPWTLHPLVPGNCSPPHSPWDLGSNISLHSLGHLPTPSQRLSPSPSFPRLF